MSRDLPTDDFRAAMHRVADLVADYLEGVGDRPVLPSVSPGEVRRVLPASPPDEPEPIDTILDDYLRVIEPNVTHWNHPGFFAYFSITGSGPGILGETLAAALNVNAMLWRTGAGRHRAEERVCDWLARMLGLPADFRGVIYDTASSSTLVALAAARDGRKGLDVRDKGISGRPDAPPLPSTAATRRTRRSRRRRSSSASGREGVRKIATRR